LTNVVLFIYGVFAYVNGHVLLHLSTYKQGFVC